jgi:adenine-specific DNA-methyltransferase
MSKPEPKEIAITSPDINAERLNTLKELFPDLFDGEGELDEKALRDLVSKDGIKTTERFSFEWAGKMQSKRNAFKPSKATLVFDKKRSIDADKTKNLIIEADNLEALKLLQTTYFERIKCIYIDPPYNTGNDFIYPDDYSEAKKAYWQKNGTVKDGVKLTSVTESTGRKHSNWLNMMQARLLYARQMLSSDGVVFISIDDNEVVNLRKLCDEIFGESNFIASISREAIKGGSLSKHIRMVHDYVLVYAKSSEELTFSGYEKEALELTLSDKKGSYAKSRELNKWGAGSRREDAPGMYFPIKNPEGEDVYPIRNDGSDGRWRLGKQRMQKLVIDEDLIFEKRNDGSYIVYEKIRSSEAGIKQFTTLFKDDYINAKGTERVKSIFELERSYFDYAKPCELIFDLTVLADVQDNDIVMDFFAGSATTADAILQRNVEDNGNRRYILVQIPEYTDEKSEAFKAGYKTISDLCIERVKRVGEKIKKENPKANIDTGFKVYKLAESHFPQNLFTPDPEKSNEDNATAFEEHLKSYKQADLFKEKIFDDVVTEIALKNGFGLFYTLEKQKDFKNNTVYLLSGNDKDTLLCLDEDIKDGTIDLLKDSHTEQQLIVSRHALDTTKKWTLQEAFKDNLNVV